MKMIDPVKDSAGLSKQAKVTEDSKKLLETAASFMTYINTNSAHKVITMLPDFVYNFQTHIISLAMEQRLVTEFCCREGM